MALAGFWYMRQNSDARAFGLAAQGEFLAQQGQLPAARRALRDAIAIRDDIAEFHLRLGRINFEMGDLPGAFVAYDFARSLAPDNVEAQLAVAQIGLQIGEFDKSKEATRQLLLENPNFIEAQIVRGVNLMLDRDFKDAIVAADEILERQPDHEQAIVLKIRATLLDGKEEEARDLVAQYASDQSNSLAVAATQLEVFRELSDAEGMIETFADLRSLAPESATLRSDEAALYYKLGQTRRATSIAVEGLTYEDVSAEDISAIVRLIRLYAPTSDLLAELPKIQAEGSEDARLEVAQLLILRGEIAAARTLIKGLSGPQVDVVLAHILQASGAYREAEQRANAVIKQDNANCLARQVRASTRLRNKNYRAAVYEAQYAVDECPTLLEAWVLLAEAYDALGRDAQVDRVYRQAMSLNTQEPALTTAYVQWLEANNRPREALAVRRTLARAMPAHLPAWQDYLVACQRFNASCIGDARRGLNESEGLFGLDPPPGERARNGLFGRFLIR